MKNDTNKKILPPKTWKNLKTHYLEVINNPWYRLLVNLEDLLSTETYKFYTKKKMKTMHLPITTESISSPMGRGSDSSSVKVNLCGVETYLADSMQFMLEYGCRLTNDGCYYVMPSFRGEDADSRHLCQFYHSEAEIPGGLEDVMSLVEEYVKYLSKMIIKNYGKEIENAIGDISHLQRAAKKSKHFKRMTFDEVEQYFKEKHPKTINKYIEYNDGWRNITRQAEKELVDEYEFVWITNYDDLTVPFYQALDEEKTGTVKNADLLMGIGETVGCGERHTNYDEVKKSLDRHEVKEDEYKWYIEMKKKYPMQTSGFGLGTERFLMWVLKQDDIRDFQICPRFNGFNIIP